MVMQETKRLRLLQFLTPPDRCFVDVEDVTLKASAAAECSASESTRGKADKRSNALVKDVFKTHGQRRSM